MAIKITPFVLMPLMMKSTSNTDFKFYDVAIVSANCLAVISTLGMNNAIARFLNESTEGDKINLLKLTVLITVSLFTLIFVLESNLKLGNVFFQANADTVIIYSFCMTVYSIVATYLRFNFQDKDLLHFSVCNSLAQFLLVYFLHFGIINIVDFLNLLSLLLLVLNTVYLYKLKAVSFNLRLYEIRRYLAYAVPFVFLLFGEWALLFSDRFIMPYLFKSDSLDVYNKIVRFNYLSQSLIFFISFIFLPKYYSRFHKSDFDKRWNQLFNYLILFLILFCLICISIPQHIIHQFGMDSDSKVFVQLNVINTLTIIIILAVSMSLHLTIEKKSFLLSVLYAFAVSVFYLLVYLIKYVGWIALPISQLFAWCLLYFSISFCTPKSKRLFLSSENFLLIAFIAISGIFVIDNNMIRVLLLLYVATKILISARLPYEFYKI